MAIWSAGVELVDEEQGKEEVSKLDMAAQGTCRPRSTFGDELHNIQSIGSSLGGLLP